MFPAECGMGMFLTNEEPPQCEPCPVGTYQPETQQYECVPCLDDKSTADVGTTSEDECRRKQWWSVQGDGGPWNLHCLSIKVLEL